MSAILAEVGLAVPAQLGLQQPPAPQRAHQRGLPLHVLELGDGEVEELDGGHQVIRGGEHT